MEKTAVEWLINQMNKSGFNLDKMDLNIFQQANQMFEQQIINARQDGIKATINGKSISNIDYYNEKFKTKYNLHKHTKL
jgi:hypothetical protein